MENNNLYRYKYSKARKKAKKIKKLYVHTIITIVMIPVLIIINKKYIPMHNWFWYPLIGMILSLFFHWINVYKEYQLIFGKKWEERKVNEIMNKEKEPNN
ncbi:2TM domain-containing protein [Tenacibaculum sp. 190524A02b]|uniref:2TM domain-containing protein n=1 Tax=Tenacibaculum vairaonense TaxID=3137860 RepID=A0ABP1FAD9_9FLAO